jgi:hypothetical protein
VTTPLTCPNGHDDWIYLEPALTCRKVRSATASLVVAGGRYEVEFDDGLERLECLSCGAVMPMTQEIEYE